MANRAGYEGRNVPKVPICQGKAYDKLYQNVRDLLQDFICSVHFVFKKERVPIIRG